VLLTDGAGDIVETQTIKEDGVFSFTIKCEAAYKIEGIKEDYTSESKSFTTTNEDKRELKLIILLDKGNIDFVTDGQAKEKALDSVSKAEIAVPEAVKDGVVIASDTAESNEVVAEVVDAAVDAVDAAKEAVVEQEIESEVVDIVDAVAEEVEETVVESNVEPEVAEAAVDNDSYPIKISPIYFDYESSWLNEKTRGELYKVVGIMKENPKMILECAGHADAKGDVKYNQWMSDRRVKRVIDYIVSKGISSSRISGKGFEEKYIVNNCVEGVECTDEERAANRRVEFVVVKM